MITLVTGGARSGKSRFAEKYAARQASYGYYIATAQAFDQEMEQRIQAHQIDRAQYSFHWHTLEAPLALTACLESIKAYVKDDDHSTNPVILIDCMTLWLSNWFMELDVEHNGTAEFLSVVNEFITYLQQYPYDIVIVTNELGDGIVPMNKLSRMYRDEAGRLNQQIAAISTQVFLVTVGIAVELKSIAYKMED